jgi:hypothetical protein
MAPQITAKQFRSWRKALGGSSVLDGITFNDGYNVATFGITQAQFMAINACAEAMAGMSSRDVTLKEINSFLAGQKVYLARVESKHIEAVEKAFQGK